MSTTTSTEVADGNDSQRELLMAIVRSIRGPVNCQDVADIMGLPTANAAQKRLKRFCDKQDPPILCIGSTLGPINTGDGTTAAKTPRKKAAGDQSATPKSPKTPKTPKSAKGTKRKVTTDDDNDAADLVAEDDADADAVKPDADDQEMDAETTPVTPGPKSPKKKAVAKPKTPKTPKSPKTPAKTAKTGSTKAKPKKDAVVAETSDTAQDDEEDNEDDKATGVGSPAKKVKMGDTVAAAVENVQAREEKEEEI